MLGKAMHALAPNGHATVCGRPQGGVRTTLESKGVNCLRCRQILKVQKRKAQEQVKLSRQSLPELPMLCDCIDCSIAGEAAH